MNWPALLRLAAVRFGVAPAAFWALSLPEWRALVAEPAGPDPLTRREFDALAAACPDEAPRP